MRQDLVINELTARMKINGNAKLNSNGNQWRPFIHARDMARVFKYFAENPEPRISGKPINIGTNSENYQIKEVCSIIQGFFPNKSISISNQSVNDPRDYQVDFSLFEKTYPNFFFEYKLIEGIKDLISHYAEINYTSAEIDKNRYIRISELKDNLSLLEL
jgi:nucleoside-diphosphate-sugar epimerase